MRAFPWALPMLLATLVAVPPAAAVESPAPPLAEGVEELRYRWRLEGVQGVLARILGVVPTTGDAVMVLTGDGQGRLQVRFTATSEKAGEDDHWTYETLVDLDGWRTLRVRETYHFRKKERDKSFELDELEVIDVLSGLQQLRYAPAAALRRVTLWSDGKTYPVTVSAQPAEPREIDGREVELELYELRGYREAGERKWKARADVWLTADAAALPVEILFRQNLGRLRLTLVDPLP